VKTADIHNREEVKGEKHMFCHKCGEKQDLRSTFCSGCGTELIKGKDYDNSSRREKKEGSVPPSTGKVTAMLLVPFLTLLLTGGGVYGYYSYEESNNHKVANWKERAEELALEGKYDEAIQYLKKARSLRPVYTILKEEISVLEKAKSYKKSMDQIAQLIKKRDYENATKQVEELKGLKKKEEAPLLNQFSAKIEEAEITITVGKIKEEVDKLTTIDELAKKLSVIKSLSSGEAAKVKDQIISRMVQITSDQAESALQDNNFSDALVIVDKAMSHSGNHEQLTALKETIQQKKSSFEKAEEERIQQAMEMAAQEDLKNRTEAVELISLETQVDEYGDLHIYGEVENTATASIYSVDISYSVYGSDGSLLTTGYTSVFPYYLNAGDTATFNDSVYYVYDEITSVEIDNITWYVE
jgi:tetratricopeptide (TPR) repeat protein